MRRKHILNLRVNDAELAAIQKLVKVSHRTRSEVVRELIRAELDKRGLWAEEDITEETD